MSLSHHHTSPWQQTLQSSKHRAWAAPNTQLETRGYNLLSGLWEALLNPYGSVSQTFDTCVPPSVIFVNAEYPSYS